MAKNNKQRMITFVLLGMVAVVWGAGFVFSDNLLKNGFSSVPGLLNACRFCIGTILLVIFLRKHINFKGRNLLYGAIGGALLFGGFMMQLVGQNYISPAHCGLFTALYFVMTPFVSWIAYKKTPSLLVFIAVAVAVCGIVVLNLGKMPTSGEFVGGALTILGALLFAIQIVWSDYLLKFNKMDSNNLVALQLIVASTLFLLYTLIFESNNYQSLQINWECCWWQLGIIAVLGTGFAYYAQTYAQNIITPAQTSLILACESPIGAAISIIIGADAFKWNIIVGGILIATSIVIIEIVPIWVENYRYNLEQKMQVILEKQSPTQTPTDTPTEYSVEIPSKK